MEYNYGDPFPEDEPYRYWVRFVAGWYDHDYPNKDFDFHHYAACMIYLYAMAAVQEWRAANAEHHLDVVLPYFRYARPISYGARVWQLWKYLCENSPDEFLKKFGPHIYQMLSDARNRPNGMSQLTIRIDDVRASTT